MVSNSDDENTIIENNDSNLIDNNNFDSNDDTNIDTNIDANDNTNFVELSIKNIKYYKSLYNLIFLYVNELKDIIKNNFVVNNINEEINEDIIRKLINKISKYHSSKNNTKSGVLTSNELSELIIDLLKLIKNILKFEKLLSHHMQVINDIDIYDKNILMSDTSKNNINKNKLHILDIYKIHSTNINNNNINIINIIAYTICDLIMNDKNYVSMLSNIHIVNSYFQKHLELIDFFILFIDFIKNKNKSDNIPQVNKYIDIIIEQNKSILLQNELEKLDIKCNKNINLNISIDSKKSAKLVKSAKTTKSKKSTDTITIIKNNLNIVKTFNNLKLLKQFNDIENILDHFNISYKSTKFTNVDIKTKLENLNKVLIENDKIHKTIFIIIECKKDLISYNIQNLLNNNIKIDKLSGISENYLNKTNTIVESSNDDIDNIYISNIQKIYIVNSSNCNVDSKSYSINIDFDNYNSKIILVHTFDHKLYNLMSNSDINAPIQFKDIVPLIKNQPSYNIENYNSMLENNILNYIETKSILDEYHKSMQFDINSYNLQNTLQMKNTISDDIYNKIKIKFTFENKNIIVDMILDIIIDNISNYIKNKNKIEYDAETYMTYLFSVNSLMNKFKKDLIDNYDDNILDKLDTLIDNIYNKILKINDNVIDKYYYAEAWSRSTQYLQ